MHTRCSCRRKKLERIFAAFDALWFSKNAEECDSFWQHYSGFISYIGLWFVFRWMVKHEEINWWGTWLNFVWKQKSVNWRDHLNKLTLSRNCHHIWCLMPYHFASIWIWWSSWQHAQNLSSLYQLQVGYCCCLLGESQLQWESIIIYDICWLCLIGFIIFLWSLFFAENIWKSLWVFLSY